MLIDLLPNAGLVNYVWLTAGAVAGLAVLRSANDIAETEGIPLSQAADDRASWLMPDEISAPRRQKRSEQRGALR
jgi:hypothetical protein